MVPTEHLAEQFDREAIEAARAMTIEQRMLAGLHLYETACEVAMAGIRHQHPEATETEVAERLDARLALARRLEEGE
ncbi:MAG: hypothetical protein ACOC46_00050 [Pirellulales bacterium]